MATKYFGPLGSDTTGDGSVGNPWATLGYALTGGRCSGGDTLIALGDTHVAASFQSVISGTGTLTISAQSSAKIIIDATVATYAMAGDDVVKIVFDESTEILSQDDGAELFRINQTDSQIELRGKLTAAAGYVGRYIARGKIKFVGADVAHTGTSIFVYNSWGTAGMDTLFDSCDIAIKKLYEDSADSSGSLFTVQDSNLDGLELGINVLGPKCEAKFLRNKVVLNTTELANPRTIVFASTASYGSIPYCQQSGNVFWFENAPSELSSTNLNGLLSIVGDSTNYYLDPTSANGLRALAGGVPVFPSLSGVVGIGDSVIWGTGATTVASRWDAEFSDIIGIDPVVSNNTAIGGLTPAGAVLNIDRAFVAHSPKYCVVSLGLNLRTGLLQSFFTPEQGAGSIIACLQKIKAYGAAPIWIGCPPSSTDSLCTREVADEKIDALNDAVQTWCAANGVVYQDVFDEMRRLHPSDWTTYYYARSGVASIENDLHPNDDGHALIGRVAAAGYIAATRGGKFSPFTPSDGILPTSAQPCKSHALPIGVGKITVFDGVASAGQIAEAVE